VYARYQSVFCGELVSRRRRLLHNLFFQTGSQMMAVYVKGEIDSRVASQSLSSIHIMSGPLVRFDVGPDGRFLIPFQTPSIISPPVAERFGPSPQTHAGSWQAGPAQFGGKPMASRGCGNRLSGEWTVGFGIAGPRKERPQANNHSPDTAFSDHSFNIVAHASGVAFLIQTVARPL